MKKFISLLAITSVIALLYWEGTTQTTQYVEDPFIIPAIANICGENTKAWHIPYSVNLPHAEDIAGFPNQDSMIHFLQLKADDLSWRSFIALNWPTDNKGFPDSTSCFASSRGRQSVWEFWMPSTELYVDKGKEARPWKYGTRFFSSRPKNGGKVSELRTVAKSNDMEIVNAENMPVIDHNGRYTLYEIFYNKVAYDFVKDMGLNTVEGQKKFTTDWPSSDPGFLYILEGDTINIQERFQRAYFPVGSIKDSTPSGKNATYIFKTGEGSIIVKSGWVVLDANDDASKYHTRQVKLPNGDKVTMGLVAMHIAHKVVEATQWVWASFEHIDNAPLLDSGGLPQLQAGVNYMYFDTTKSSLGSFNNPPMLKFQPNKAKRECSQVVTLNQPYPEAIQTNDTYHKMIKDADPNSVWLNYRLVGTQWPFDPTLFTSGNQYKPTILANSLLETYKQNTSSCMSCHKNAKFGTIEGRTGPQYNADFIFGLSSAK